MKRTRLFKFGLFGIFLTLLFGSGISACVTDEPDFYESPKLEKRYLLSGDEIIPNSGDFIYYQISNDAYAIGLKETARNNTGTLNIPLKYNNKPITGIYHDGFRSCKYSTINLIVNDPDNGNEPSSNITTIDFGAFMGSNITSITIPYSVNQIGEAAFYSCRKLTNVRFNNSSASGADSSSACACPGESLTPAEIHYNDLDTIPSFCFFNCVELLDVMIPSKIKTIGYEAFNGCKKLNTFFSFTKLKTIHARAFQGCESLTEMYIPKYFFDADGGVGTIEELAFNYCSSSMHFYFAAASNNVVTDWISSHQNWGWYNERLAPASNRYGNANWTYSSASVTYTEDWRYSTTNGEVTIEAYIGPTQINGHNIEFIAVPDNLPIGSENIVTKILPEAFNSVRTIIKRLYLPKGLKRIANKMFNLIKINNTDVRYENLVVIDDNTRCSIDSEVAAIEAKGNEATEEELARKNALRATYHEKRIRFDQLTSLEIIGDEAFVNLSKLAQITQLYLPYSIVGVGNYAFGKQGNSNMYLMNGVTDFKWIYDEEKSALVFLGRDSFFKVGNKDNYSDLDNLAKDKKFTNNPQYDTSGRKLYETTTLVLPRTFTHTGYTASEKSTYGFTSDPDRSGDHAFGGCPLISKVIIKGSTEATLKDSSKATDSNVGNLAIGAQTFASCESLRTIVIEERKGKTIVFHTQNGNWTQPCIGWSGGKNKLDYSSCPLLQSLVLPSKYTTLRIQNLAFQGNTRAAIYLSGDMTKITGHTNDNLRNSFNSPNANTTDLSNAKLWKTVGNENFCDVGSGSSTSKEYNGFCFANAIKPRNDASIINKYGINQETKVYQNVHYKEVINEDYIINMQTVHNDETDKDEIVNVGTTVELGKYYDYEVADNLKENNKKDLVMYSDPNDNGKFAIICDIENNKAIVSRQLYDRQDSSFTGTAKVPYQVQAYNGTNYTVKEIGDSAFSCSYCDQTCWSSFKELTSVMVPDTIETIGEYAFFRAYGVTNLYSYNVSTSDSNGDYVMPSNLDYIGKHAFAFCNIEQFLKIPDECTFYENKNSTTDFETSCFTNNFSLRKITFVKNSVEDTESKYYKTTTYTSTSTGNPTYTTALYSKNTTSDSKFAHNKNALLIVLYRDSADKAAYGSTDTEKVTINSNTNCIKFDGQYKVNVDGESNPIAQDNYLYGAYKMAYWIDELELGTPSNTSLVQPIISGIYDRTNNKDKLLYIDTPADDFRDMGCDLKKATLSSLSVQQYAFSGCEQLEIVGLPQVNGGEVPEGLFDSVENTGLKYTVPSNDAGTTTVTGAIGELDLSYTKYSKIKANAFINTGVSSFKAPKTAGNFTVEASAFENCDQLVSVDFSQVQGTVTIGKDAFKDCDNLTTLDFSNITSTSTASIGENAFESCDLLNTIDCSNCTTVTINTNGFKDCDALQDIDFTSATSLNIGNYAFNSAKIYDTTYSGITWPTSSSAEIRFGDHAFTKCEFESESFTLPYQLRDLGTNAFNGCSTLHTVTADGNLTNIFTIGTGSFRECTNLNNFDFTKFTALTTIGDGAFKMDKTSNSAIICPNGVINLPSSLTTIKATAFQRSKITEVYINSTDVITLGKNAFADCTALKWIYFNDPRSGWIPKDGDAVGQFDNCTSLTELWITSNGNDIGIDYNASDSFIDGTNDSIIAFFTYTKFDDSIALSNSTWRQYDSTNEYTIETFYFYIENEDDIIVDNGNNTYSLAFENAYDTEHDTSDTHINFWMFDPNGDGTTSKSNVVELGYILSFNSSTGDVTFSSGYVLDKDGNLTPPAP